MPTILEYSKTRSIKRKVVEKKEPELSNEEILKRIEKRRQEEQSSKIKPLYLKRKMVASAVDRYEEILLKEIHGEFLTEEEHIFKKQYELSMSDDERKRWEYFIKLRAEEA